MDCQVAYRRSRGTEPQLLELADFVREMPPRGKRAYTASVNVDGAFDTASHSQLMQTMDNLGVDCYAHRYLVTWLSQSQLSVCPYDPKGRFYKSWRHLSRVLQGGFLSPVLWLLHFNSLAPKLVAAGEQRMVPPEGLTYRYLRYAEDVVCAMVH